MLNDVKEREDDGETISGREKRGSEREGERESKRVSERKKEDSKSVAEGEERDEMHHFLHAIRAPSASLD